MIENEKNPTTLRINDEIGKIENYVEQALYYARSTDVEKDFKVEKTSLKVITASEVILQTTDTGGWKAGYGRA